MKEFHTLGLSAVMSALLVVAAAEADARRPVGGPRPVRPVILIEREAVVVDKVEAKQEEAPAVPPPAPAAPAPEPRKPYAIGSSYSSLPSGCMKMIEDGASYYHCSGEWYRQAGSGSGYVAVKAP